MIHRSLTIKGIEEFDSSHAFVIASESCLTLLFVRSVPSVSFVQNGDLIDLLLLLLIDPYMSQTACFGNKRNTYGSMSFLLEFGWRRKKEWWIVCT